MPKRSKLVATDPTRNVFYNPKAGDKVNMVANGNLIITPMVER